MNNESRKWLKYITNDLKSTGAKDVGRRQKTDLHGQTSDWGEDLDRFKVYWLKVASGYLRTVIRRSRDQQQIDMESHGCLLAIKKFWMRRTFLSRQTHLIPSSHLHGLAHCHLHCWTVQKWSTWPVYNVHTLWRSFLSKNTYFFFVKKDFLKPTVHFNIVLMGKSVSR